MDLHLLALEPPDLVAGLRARGVTCDETDARRVLARVISDGAADPFPDRRPRRREVRAALRERARLDRPEVVARVADPVDNSVRYLLRAADGATLEAVRIGLLKPSHFTVCLSTQAGCAMACAFCATGRLGLGRHLTVPEIVGQLLTVRDEAPGRVSGAVFMGQGEPLHNYDATLKAAAILSHPCGGRIAREAISVSTVGLVDRVRRFTAEGHDYRLVVSLHSTIPERRAALLPVAGKLDFDDLVDAIAEHGRARRTRVTVGWTLIGGLNHGPDEIEGLRRVAARAEIRLDIIDVNDDRPDGYRRATDVERGAFLDAVMGMGIPVVRRYSVGRASNAACGMLASRGIAGLRTG